MIIKEIEDGQKFLQFDPRIIISEQIHYMINNNIKWLVINFVIEAKSSRGYEVLDVDDSFRTVSKYLDFNFIDRLSVSPRKFDLMGLDKFRNLVSLSINDEGSQELDFSHFVSLEVLNFYWRKQTKNLGLCVNLKELGIKKYNKDDLTEFKMAKKMESLSVYKSSIKSLAGIEEMTRIQWLDFYSCPKLKDISSLENINTLTYVDFYLWLVFPSSAPPVVGCLVFRPGG